MDVAARHHLVDLVETHARLRGHGVGLGALLGLGDLLRLLDVGDDVERLAGAGNLGETEDLDRRGGPASRS